MLKRIMIAAAFASILGTIGVVHAEERLHPIEKMCIEYETVGQLINGTSLECHRAYGVENFKIEDNKIGFGDLVQKQHNHTISIAEKIYKIDKATNTATVSISPIYEDMRDGFAKTDQSSEEFSKTFIAAMGLVPQGVFKAIAGLECEIFLSQGIGNVCLTKEAIMLQQDFLGNTRTATRVTIGDDGGEKNYTLWQKMKLK